MRYFIEYQDHDGDWFCDHYCATTPTTIEQAADLLVIVKEENRFLVNFRVTAFNSVRGIDATAAIEQHIEDRETAAAKEAAEDEAHERQERHSWGEV